MDANDAAECIRPQSARPGQQTKERDTDAYTIGLIQVIIFHSCT